MNQQFSFPIKYGLSKTGLPLIVVKIFNHDICLMLGTGCNRNIIDQQIYEHFRDKLAIQEASQEVLTLNGTAKGLTINLPFIFEHQEYNEPFICSNDTDPFKQIENESGIRIYGILGNNFFLKHEWIIDFERQEVYNKSKNNT